MPQIQSNYKAFILQIRVKESLTVQAILLLQKMTSALETNKIERQGVERFYQ